VPRRAPGEIRDEADTAGVAFSVPDARVLQGVLPPAHGLEDVLDVVSASVWLGGGGGEGKAD